MKENSFQTQQEMKDSREEKKLHCPDWRRETVAQEVMSGMSMNWPGRFIRSEGNSLGSLLLMMRKI